MVAEMGVSGRSSVGELTSPGDVLATIRTESGGMRIDRLIDHVTSTLPINGVHAGTLTGGGT